MARFAGAALLAARDRMGDTGRVQNIEVGDAGIRLGQLLKLLGVVDSGGEAKSLLTEGRVRVNGAVETRRGAQLRPGDIVQAPGGTCTLTGPS